MTSEDIYKYLGLAIVVVFVAYIAIKSLTFQARLIEGMKSKDKESETTTDKDKVADAIKSKTNAMLDSLLIDKYRSSYDDTIIELEEYINVAILTYVTSFAETIATPGPSSTAMMTSLNTLQAFKATLNDSMKFLDGMKSSNSGSGKSGKFF
uniref:Uncharacterized protein n=1 Tax=viral metagenome TaxID=1070528 RepID=A0A6C0HH90_9ZZZZ